MEATALTKRYGPESAAGSLEFTVRLTPVLALAADLPHRLVA